MARGYQVISDLDIARVLQDMDDDEEKDNNPVFDFSDESDGEVEVVQHDDHSSDSDCSGDEADIPPPTFSEDENTDFDIFFGKNGETFWISNNLTLPTQKTKSKNLIKIFPGSTRFTRDIKSELDIFFSFIPIEMIDKIVFYTNKFIEKRAVKVQNRCIEQNKEFRIRNFKPTSRNEILALIGILFYLATCKGNRANAKSFWKPDGTGMVLFRAAFSYDRFFFLLQTLRFDDIDTRFEREKTDKLAAIREMYTCFNDNSKRNYSPSEFVTIDEMLYGFRGRCGFIQYMPAKPAKYGLKMYALCDARTFYVHNFEIYCGTQKEGPFYVSNKPHDIVMRLIEPLKNTRRNLTTDNYYGSYPLALELLENGITLITTLKKNKPDIPPEFLPNKQREVKSTLFGFQDECTLVSFIPKKNKAVILLSTMHDSGDIDPETGKPEIIHDYNRTKSGVDTVDQKCSVASTGRNTRRWPLALFFRILDMAGVNSHVLYVDNNMSECNRTQSQFRRLNFLQRLSKALLQERFKERATTKGLPKDVKCFLSSYRNSENALQPCGSGRDNSLPRTGACHSCGSKRNNKTTVRCSLCNKFTCKQHCITSTKCYLCQNAEDSDANMESCDET